MRFKFEAMNYQREQEKLLPAASCTVCSLPLTVEFSAELGVAVDAESSRTGLSALSQGAAQVSFSLPES